MFPLHILEDATYVRIHLMQHMCVIQDCSSFPLDFLLWFHIFQYVGIYQLLFRMQYEGKCQKKYILIQEVFVPLNNFIEEAL